MHIRVHYLDLQIIVLVLVLVRCSERVKRMNEMEQTRERIQTGFFLKCISKHFQFGFNRSRFYRCNEPKPMLELRRRCWVRRTRSFPFNYSCCLHTPTILLYSNTGRRWVHLNRCFQLNWHHYINV